MTDQYLHYDPYCPICGGCGEEGCCSPLRCEQSTDGKFCGSYLKDLKFGYAMNEFVEKNLIDKLPQDLKDEYNKEWEYMLERYYNPPIVKEPEDKTFKKKSTWTKKVRGIDASKGPKNQ